MVSRKRGILLWVNWLDAFSEVPDPRINGHRKHLLVEVIVLAVAAVMCGADSWTSVEQFCKCRAKIFKKILTLKNGIPSHDTFSRVFSLLNAKAFERAFANLYKAALEPTLDSKEKKHVAIDGKELKNARNKGLKETPLRLVNAWASESGLSIAHAKTNSKSNEITAIPEVLDLFNVSQAVVTIDAIGCQKDIAAKIKNGDGDFVIALKKNQKNLYIQSKILMDRIIRGETKANDFDYFETNERIRGRDEERRYWVTQNISQIDNIEDWKGILSIGCVQSNRRINGKTTQEIRYFITSLPAKASQFAHFVRSHWKIENSYHWVMDVQFHSDFLRMRTGNAAQNFSLLQSLALNLLKTEKKFKGGPKVRMRQCNWDDKYFLKVLTGC